MSKAGRLGLGFLLALLALIEINSLAIVQAGQARAREAAIADLRSVLLESRARLEQTLVRDGPDACARHARQRLPRVAEAEILDASGSLLAASPAPSPVRHVLSKEQATRLARRGAIISVGPVRSRTFPRVLVFTQLHPPDHAAVILRVATDAQDLAADLQERRWLLFLHGVALALLVLAGLAGIIASSRPSDVSSEGAMGAYEAAMAQLADRGREVARSHATEVRRLQDTLESREAMARAGELTSGIVHEVRNGLGTIGGYARLAGKACTEARVADAQAAATAILDECALLENVVRRFAEFVRTETLQRAPVDLRRLLERVIARDGRDGLASVELQGACAALDADEDLLERALDNLVRNAREAAGQNGRVTVGLSDEPPGVRVTITDDGPGLPHNLADGIRPFATTKPGGLGLGLPTAIKVVRLHGGTLTLTSQAPKGLKAEVLLPREGRVDTNGSGAQPLPGQERTAVE